MNKSEQGRRNRKFGHDREREWARELREETKQFAERITTESKHGNVGDVVHKPHPDFKIKYQVRSGKGPSPWRAMADSIQATAGTEYIPAALVNRCRGRGHDRESYVMMCREDFVSLMKLAFSNNDEDADVST